MDLIAQGKSMCMVAWQNREVVDVMLDDVITRNRCVNLDGALVRTARGLGISLGD